jgi:hypothetical protein
LKYLDSGFRRNDDFYGNSPFYETVKVDGFVKRLKMLIFVIPVETGIQSFQSLCRFWIPAYAGMTTFYEIIKV